MVLFFVLVALLSLQHCIPYKKKNYFFVVKVLLLPKKQSSDYSICCFKASESGMRREYLLLQFSQHPRFFRQNFAITANESIFMGSANGTTGTVTCHSK